MDDERTPLLTPPCYELSDMTTHAGQHTNTNDGSNGTPTGAVSPDTGHALPWHMDKERGNDHWLKLPWHIDEKRGNKPWLKLLLRLLVFSPFKWYRGSLWISVPHILAFAVYLAKLCFTTYAVFTFGGCREQLSYDFTHGQLVIKHNLLKEWSASYETLPYPPSIGPFAVYNIEDFIDRINFAVEGYYNMEYQATGNYQILPVDGMIMTFNYIVVADSVRKNSSSFEPNHGLTNVTKNGHAVYKYDLLTELEYYNLTDVFHRILDVTLNASLHSFRVPRDGGIMCLKIEIVIKHDDKDFNGEVDISLQTETSTVACQIMNISDTDRKMCEGYRDWLHICILLFTITTVVLDLLSFVTGVVICCCYCCCCCSKTNVKQFCSYLVRWWSMVSSIGDGLILRGVCMLHNGNGGQDETNLQYSDEIAFYLGIGCLLCWIGSMRYLKINKKFSLLFHTIFHAKWNILAFLFCTGTLFVGYWACAFVTLEVYHPKYETKALAAESLFSLMYGDDIFGTVTSVHYENAGNVKWLKASVSIVIYSFVILFTLLALNLIIALINTSYATINEMETNEVFNNSETDVSMFNYLNEDTCACCKSSDESCCCCCCCCGCCTCCDDLCSRGPCERIANICFFRIR